MTWILISLLVWFVFTLVLPLYTHPRVKVFTAIFWPITVPAILIAKVLNSSVED